ncbi:MAG: hypothetical protein R3C56_37600 [Pirellulaceae bacterium]
MIVLRGPEFKDELQLTLEQQRAILGFREKFRLRTESYKSSTDPEAEVALLVALLDAEIQAAITPEQYARVKQLCYRIEIGILGIENSVAYGTLSRRIGLYDNQRTHIHDKGLKIRIAARNECDEIMQRAENEAVQAFPNALQPIVKTQSGTFSF